MEHEILSEQWEQAGAVCYRFNKEEIEFLLVKTKGGLRWTFPKGNIEKGEELRQAASREAFEEAGVRGEIAKEQFTSYTHLKGKGVEIKIHAFLLKVTSCEGKGEKGRTPTWFCPSEARKALMAKRELKYALEFQRVLAIASRRIDFPVDR